MAWSRLLVPALGLGLAVAATRARAEHPPIRLPPAVVETLRAGPARGIDQDAASLINRALKPVLQPLFDELFAAEGADLRITAQGKPASEGGGTEIQALCYAQRDRGPDPAWWASVWLRVNEAADAEVTRPYREWRGRLERATTPTARTLGALTAFGDSSLRGDQGFASYRWFADGDHLMVLLKSARGEEAGARAKQLHALLTRHGLYSLRQRLLGAGAPPAATPKPLSVRLFDANPLYLAGRAPEESPQADELLARLTQERVAVAGDGLSRVVLRLDLDAPGVARLIVPDDERPFDDGRVTMLFGGRTAEVESAGRKSHVALALYTPPPSFEEPRRRVADGEAPPPGARALLRDVVATRTARLALELGPDAARMEARPEPVDVALVRPPTVLIHGTFDDPVECWDRSAREPPAEPAAGEVSMVTALRRQGHAVFLLDFRETNGSSRGRPKDSDFAGNARTFWTAPMGAYDALRTYREGLDVAVAQVDVVGHSLGGLIPRLWASTHYNPPGDAAPVFDRERTRAFRRADNFGRGDVHRLVTIGTPHQGSDFASLAVALQDMPPPLRAALATLLGHRSPEPALWLAERAAIQYLRLAEGYGVSPVVRDQAAYLPSQPNEALRRVGPTPVPSHAVVCTAALPDLLRFGETYKMPMRVVAWWLLNARPASVGSFFTLRGQQRELPRIYGESQDAGGRHGSDAAGGESWLFDESWTPAPSQQFTLYALGRAVLFGNTQNDMIVRVQSQTGGLPLQCTSLVRGVLHSFASRYAAVQERVVEALGGAAWRFHAEGFLEPGPMENVAAFVAMQSPARRAEAVESSNIPPSHAEAISHVAVANDTFILHRPVNRHAEALVAAHMATKDMHVKGKSASWGPQRGFIPVQQRFSKMWLDEREKIPRFDHKVEECLHAGRARQSPLRVLAHGREHEVLVVRGEGLDALDAIVLRPVAGGELRGWRNGSGQDFDPASALPAPSLPPTEIERRGLEPLMVLADRHSALPLTADFDLLAVAARAPCDAPRDDPEQGFVCDWQVELIRRINEQVRLRANYVGGNVVHHGPEANFPLSEGADYPIAVFEPSGRIGVVPKGPPGEHDRHLKAYFHRLIGWGYSVRPNLQRWDWGPYDPERYPTTGWRPQDRALLPEAASSPDDPFDSHEGDELVLPAAAGSGGR